MDVRCWHTNTWTNLQGLRSTGLGFNKVHNQPCSPDQANFGARTYMGAKVRTCGSVLTVLQHAANLFQGGLRGRQIQTTLNKTIVHVNQFCWFYINYRFSTHPSYQSNFKKERQLTLKTESLTNEPLLFICIQWRWASRTELQFINRSITQLIIQNFFKYMSSSPLWLT